jgi:hypothetical protein
MPVIRLFLLALLFGACSKPPPKHVAPPPWCYRTSSQKDWIDPIDCRKRPDWIDPWADEDGGAHGSK